MYKNEKDVGVVYLAPYMKEVMKKLEEYKKRPAVHTYNATLNSFTKFSVGIEAEKAMNESTTMLENERKHLSEGGKREIPITEAFTPGKLKEYQIWLRNRDASWNTVSTYMRTLKAVYNRLVVAKLLEYDKKLFDDVYTKVESQTKRALTEEQMNVLLHVGTGKLPEDLQSAHAYFLLMFLFRGMSFIDLAYLRRQDVKGNCITYCRHKTRRKIVVRIAKEAMPLFEEYRSRGTGSGYLFPILDEVGKEDKEDYIRYQKALRIFNCKLAKLAELLLPDAKISSYTARHTWATLAFYAGIPIGIISKALGHSSIKVTETYLKPFENEKLDEANDELIMSIAKSNEDKKVA